MAGCWGTDRLGRAPDDIDARVDRQRTPEQTLKRLAEAQANAPPRTPGETAPVPVPPGVEQRVLGQRLASDARATLNLNDALGELVSAHPFAAAAVTDAPPLDAAARDQALRHYVKGRDAALANRHFVAITELEKALAVDANSPAALRQLARSYLAMGNALKAATLYERLLRIEPDDSEALFTLGLAAASRRRFERAAAALGRPRLHGTSFDHDPAAGYLADFYLVAALQQLGYDRASIELGRSLVVSLPAHLARPSPYSHRLESVYRQRGEIWRAVGDAHCRLGEYERALEAYRQSALVADRAALHPRMIYADLRLGRTYSAQYELLKALSDETSSLSDRDIHLCSYLAQHVDQLELLGQAVEQLYRRQPDHPGLARAAAVLLPRDSAVRLLREFLDRCPNDLDVVSQLLGWLVRQDEASAIDLTVALAGARPHLAAAYADRLALAAPHPAALIDALGGLPASPPQAVVHSRLLAYLGSLGESWQVCRSAVDTWPDDWALLSQQVNLAAQLGEPQLLEEAIDTAQRFDDPQTWLARARARRAVGQTELAVRAATAAVGLAPNDVRALVELAEAHAAHAATLPDPSDRRQHTDNAVIAAQQAIELDPQLDEAYAILFALYGPNGSLSNPTRFSETRDALAAANAQSRLFDRLAAADAMRRGRFEAALERVLNLYDSDPWDTESLNLAVTAWMQLGRLDAAQLWLDERLARRPGDPALLGQWVRLQLRRDRADAAVQRIEQVLHAEPANEAARRVLESLYRLTGRLDRAVQLAEHRLLSRPQGVRRELELAAMYAGASRDDAAVERLLWILDRCDTATLDHLVSAMGVAGRLSDADPNYDPLVLEFAQRIVERFPDAPLQVYGTGLRSLARMDGLDERFDALADRAVRNARGASGSSVQAADLWRQLAQALVDAHQPAAAARALRVRLLAEAPLDAPAVSLLATGALVADAVADQADESIALIHALALQDRLPAIDDLDSETALPETLFDAGNIYSLLGNESGAQQLLREAIDLDPTHAIALNNLGYMRLELDLADDETAALIQRAHELAPEDPNVLDTIGWLRYKQGQFRDDQDAPGALSLIEQALAGEPDEPGPEVLDHLGDTRWRLGDAEGAADAWRRAVEILDDHERRERLLRSYLLVQTRRWGLLVVDPAEMYDRQFGVVLRRARGKLEATQQGEEPGVAATFDELSATDSPGETNDGRP